jgi:large subunit ribosomal protein L29
MKIKEIREKESNHLVLELKDLDKKLFELRSQSVTEKLEDPTMLGKVRRDIARVKTVIRQRELEEAAKAASAAASAASASQPQPATT